MNDLLVGIDPGALGALPFILGGLGSSLKKLVKSVGNIGQKVIDVHKNVIKKVEQTARPITKLAAVAAATYYGGPMGGQLAAQLAFKQKSSGESPQPVGVPYTEYASAYDPRYDAGVMGGIYPASQPFFETTGAPLGMFAGGSDAPAPSAGIPPLVWIAGGGALLVIVVALIVRK
jgi:hypothetical protein